MTTGEVSKTERACADQDKDADGDDSAPHLPNLQPLTELTTPFRARSVPRWTSEGGNVDSVTKRHWSEKRQQATLASAAGAGYLAPMTRRFAYGLILLTALAPCTSSGSLSPSDEATVQYARYYFIEPTDTGVLEVWARPGTVCYSTQSYPARPIDLIVRANGASNRVASYEPPRVQYCDRAVEKEVAAALISDPSSFVIRWAPQAGAPIVMTPLTPTSST